jgi:hypothetical protein
MTARRALLTAALATATLAGAAASAQAAAAPPAFVPVRVALDAAPLSGATVTLRAADGTLIGRDTTGSLGVSLADLTIARAPRAFTVSVSGGRLGTTPLHGVLRADVRGYKAGKTVIVDLATTLAAADRRARHSTTTAAETRVKAHLGLSSQLALGTRPIGATTTTGSVRDGRVDRWLAAQLPTVDRRAHAAAPRQAGTTGLATTTLAEGVASIPGPLELLNVGFILYAVYENLFADSGSGSNTTSTQLTQIENDLSTLQSSVDTLTTQVTSLGYSNGANQIAGAIADVVSAYTSYTTLQAAATQTGGDANSAQQSVVATYGSQIVNGQPLTSLGQITAANLPTIVANAPATSFVGSVRADNLTTTATAIQIATVAGANPGSGTAGIGGPAPGANGLVAEASQASTANVRFFDGDDAAVARAVWRYYADAFSAAASVTSYYQLMTTVAGLSDPLPQTIDCGQATTSSDPTVMALETNIAQLQCYQGALQALQPTPFPAGAVLDLTSYTMWSTEVGAQLSQPTWSALNGVPATLSPSGVQTASTTLAPGSGADTALLGASPQTPSVDGSALADWQVATATQLGTLYANSTTGSTLISAGFDANLLYPGGNGTQIQWSKDDNSYWGPNGASTTVRTSDGCATTGYSCGFSVSQYVPLASIGSCSQPCVSPSYASGTTLGLWDLNNGGDLYTDPQTTSINSINGPQLANVSYGTPQVDSPTDAGSTFTYNWSNLYNWDGAFQSCNAFLALGNASCGSDSNTYYPNIEATLSSQGLPSLFSRAPTSSECYYWPAGSGSAPPAGQTPATQAAGTTNGCPGA